MTASDLYLIFKLVNNHPSAVYHRQLGEYEAWSKVPDRQYYSKKLILFPDLQHTGCKSIGRDFMQIILQRFKLYLELFKILIGHGTCNIDIVFKVNFFSFHSVKRFFRNVWSFLEKTIQKYVEIHFKTLLRRRTVGSGTDFFVYSRFSSI